MSRAATKKLLRPRGPQHESPQTATSSSSNFHNLQSSTPQIIFVIQLVEHI